MHAFSKIFKNLQILEFASALAGPQAGTFFKELGAEVIKIEPPTGDVTRKWKLPSELPKVDNTFYYCSVNGNKTTLRLNLNKRENSAKVTSLIKKADILITNFTKRQAEKFKLDFTNVIKIKSDIILANVTGFGINSNRAAFDVLLQAESGLLAMNGHPDQNPMRIPIPIIDILTAHQVKEGLLCALLKKSMTGQGSEIQVSLYDSALSALANPATNFLMGNIVTKPVGSPHPGIAPYGDLYKTQDEQWLILAIGSDQQFSRLCQSMEAEDISRDERFQTNWARVKFRQELNQALSSFFSKKTKSEWVRIFEMHNVPAGTLQNIAEALTSGAAFKNIITEEFKDGTKSTRMRQVAFL